MSFTQVPQVTSTSRAVPCSSCYQLCAVLCSAGFSWLSTNHTVKYWDSKSILEFLDCLKTERLLGYLRTRLQLLPFVVMLLVRNCQRNCRIRKWKYEKQIRVRWSSNVWNTKVLKIVDQIVFFLGKFCNVSNNSPYRKLILSHSTSRMKSLYYQKCSVCEDLLRISSLLTWMTDWDLKGE